MGACDKKDAPTICLIRCKRAMRITPARFYTWVHYNPYVGVVSLWVIRKRLSSTFLNFTVLSARFSLSFKNTGSELCQRFRKPPFSSSTQIRKGSVFECLHFEQPERFQAYAFSIVLVWTMGENAISKTTSVDMWRHLSPIASVWTAKTEAFENAALSIVSVWTMGENASTKTHQWKCITVDGALEDPSEEIVM